MVKEDIVILILGIILYGIISELVVPNAVFWQRLLLFMIVFVPLAHMIKKRLKKRNQNKILKQIKLEILPAN